MTTYQEHTVSVAELAERLPQLLDEVERGSTVTIIRQGVPVALLSPSGGDRNQPAGAGHAHEVRAPYGVAATVDSQRGSSDTALVRLLGSDSVRKVFALFVREPDRTIHQREVARRAEIGLRSAQIALERLEQLGFLTSWRDGNRRYYRAVRSERFEDVRALLSRELGISEVVGRHLRALAEPVEWAFIFGSVASGRDSVTSDIDLVVVSEASDDELVAPIAEAQRELRREIEVVRYAPQEFRAKRSAGNHFIRTILDQPRIDVIGGPDDA